MTHATLLHTAASSREAEYLSGWKRARAELANVRSRLDGERQKQRQSITRDVLESFLELADNFQALIDHTPEDLEEHAWTQGVHHVSRQFSATLASHGINPINPQGQPFDPHTHEAIEQVEGDGQTDQVVEVVQVGYRLGEQLLRPAKVKVGK